MVSGIITEVFTVVAAVISGLGALFTDLIELVYDSGLTDFGTLVILVASVPLAWSLVQYMLGLFKSATKIKSSR
jgi:uncharacterized membrane protein